MTKSPLLFAFLWTLLPCAHAELDFNRDVRPILFNNCVACHGPDDGHREAKLRLDQHEFAVAAGAIVPGKKEDSEMWIRINDSEDPMPPKTSGHQLTKKQIETIGAWIDAGAEYDTHWSFKTPSRTDLPVVSNPTWPSNPIDHFVLERLDREGLKPSPLSDPYALLRRLSLDLVGLPPTTAEADAFAKDPSTAAYEAHVDRLLASPAYGERWARMWLDLARYADSRGYGSDPLRTIWRYRDWVIDAFNRNIPFDQFTIEQLAGDLLPNPTTEQKLATAFHRNTLTNTLGGTIDEEFRVIAVKDRTNTTGQVWMGLTVGCAQCHTHKFDPITHEEYYSLYAIFNQTEDRDLPSEAPVIPTPSPEDFEKMAAMEKRITEAQASLNDRPKEFYDRLAHWEASASIGSTWTTLTPTELKADSGATFTTDPDGTIHVSEKSAKNDTYTITLPNPAENITALRIDTPANAGRDKNFVITELSLAVNTNPNTVTKLPARYVRVELAGAEKMIHLAEVEVLVDGLNVATKGTAKQSSTGFGGTANLAIDGNTDGNYDNKSVSHTNVSNDPWWELDLGEEKAIDQIILYSRTDNGLVKRHDGIKLIVLDANQKPVWEKHFPKAEAKLESSFSGSSTVQLKNASATFSQDQFDASNAIDNNTGKDSGWAVHPASEEPQSLFVELDRAVAQPNSTLTLTITQNYPDHALGHFRISATTDPTPLPALPANLAEALATPPANRSAAQSEAILNHYSAMDPWTQDKMAELNKRKKQLADYRPVSTPVMRELPPDKRRQTHLMEKGNYLQPAQVVSPGVPAAFPPLKLEPDQTPDRLALAKWLVSSENPLTARVTVNRFWAKLFGTGFVETEEDFGTQGTYPSHPELLDWLALHFRDDLKWDTKALLKTIVMSSTYRQSNKITPEHLERDPNNRLLARGPRFRLEAEMVRDQALAASGLLSNKMFGPSVFPPQPEGLWRAAFNGERTWETSQGDDRYRRGVYTFLRRSTPYPSMITFDAPNREICTIRRIRTNTPLQAFVTMNDPAYVEIAQALARRLILEGGSSTSDRIRFGLKICLQRNPSPEQISAIEKLYASELEHYLDASPEARLLATDPLGPLPENFPASEAETAAWTVVANVLLNLDAMMMK